MTAPPDCAADTADAASGGGRFCSFKCCTGPSFAAEAPTALARAPTLVVAPSLAETIDASPATASGRCTFPFNLGFATTAAVSAAATAAAATRENTPSITGRTHFTHCRQPPLARDGALPSGIRSMRTAPSSSCAATRGCSGFVQPWTPVLEGRVRVERATSQRSSVRGRQNRRTRNPSVQLTKCAIGICATSLAMSALIASTSCAVKETVETCGIPELNPRMDSNGEARRIGK